MRRLAGWTEAHYLTLAPHNVGGPVATAANVHFAVATRNVDILEHFNDFADRVGERARRRRADASTRPTAASRSRSVRGSACAWTTTRARGIRGPAPGSSCSWTAGRSAKADPPPDGVR